MIAMLVLICVGSAPSEAAEVAVRIEWDEPELRSALSPELHLVPGPGGTDHAVNVDAAPGRPYRVRLADLPDLDITAPRWALRGQIRCRGVSQRGYLEMWSVFPDGRKYFSRTLSPSGPSRALEGTQAWRRCVVPFFSRPNAPPPERIELNLVLPDGGAVDVGPMELITFEENENPLRPPHTWWGHYGGALLGAGLGGGIGLLGALIGVLVGTGKARRTTSTLLWLMAVVGLTLVGLGAAALAFSQPYAVWYPLLLTGAIAAVLGLALRPVLRRRYQDLEERKMRALDA